MTTTIDTYLVSRADAVPPSDEGREHVLTRRERGWAFDVLWHKYITALWALDCEVQS